MTDENVKIIVDGAIIGVAQVDTHSNAVHRLLLQLPEGMGDFAAVTTRKWLQNTIFQVDTHGAEPAPQFYLSNFNTMLANGIAVVEPLGGAVRWLPNDPLAPEIDLQRVRDIFHDPSLTLQQVMPRAGRGFSMDTMAYEGRTGSWTFKLTFHNDERAWDFQMESAHEDVPDLEMWLENGSMMCGIEWITAREDVDMRDAYAVLTYAREQQGQMVAAWVQRCKRQLATALTEQAAIVSGEPTDAGAW